MRVATKETEAITYPSSPFLTCTIAENQQTTLPLPPLTLRYETTLSYRCGERNGACRLRLFWPTQGVPARENPAVALVTEMPECGGVSITNGIEAIACEISRCYGLNPQHTVLIEHYDDRERGMAACLPGRINGEKFSCVTFGELRPLATAPQTLQVRRPQWRSLGKEEVEMLLGSPLP